MRVACSSGVTVEMLGHNDVRRQRGQFRRVSASITGHAAALAPDVIWPNISTVTPVLRATRIY